MRRKRPSRRRARERDHALDDEQQMATPAEIDAAYEAVAGNEDAEDDSPVDDVPGGAASNDYNAEEFEAFVPVGRDEYETYTAEDDAAEDSDTVQRRRFPRPEFSFAVQGDVLVVALALIAAGIFGTLLVRGDVGDQVREWWPLAILAAALVWMVFALVRRHVASFLGAAAFAGVGLSLLMDTQDIAHAEETLLGVVLITAGLGIAVRGLLLRQRTAYS
jgi:hypothetical protein